MENNEKENCINCNKEYTKRGMKNHLNKCNLIYEEVRKKEKEKLEKEANKLKIVFTYNNKLNLFNLIPDDCIKIIYEYLLLKDNNVSFLRLHNEINNVAFTCKSFYINKPNMNFIYKNINEEMNETICRSWCKNLYGLDENDLIDIDYDIVRRYGGYTMHLFEITDIKDCAYEKYGTEYDYKNYLIKKELLKSMTKKEKDEIFEIRKKEYDILFQKYDYPKNGFLESLYSKYIDYIKKKVPTLSTIEKSIQIKLYAQERLNKLKKHIKLLNISYYETNEAYSYIYYNCDMYLAIESIKRRSLKEENYNMFINEFNYNKSEYDLYAYEYINNNNNTEINYLFETINDIELCKKNIYSQTNIKNMKNKDDIQNYLFKIIDQWTDKNYEKDIKNISFYTLLSNKLKTKLKDRLRYHNEYKNTVLNKTKERDESINNYKLKKTCTNITQIKCVCDNIGSPKCISYLCVNCCINVNCTRHYK